MIDAGWLVIMGPVFVLGVLCGGLMVDRVYTRNSVNAKNALKRAEAYETYRKAIGK